MVGSKTLWAYEAIRAMTKKDFNGYSFDDPKMRKRMKFIVVTRGDLDLNGCYAFSSKIELKKYLKSVHRYKEVEAVFEIKDITPTDL